MLVQLRTSRSVIRASGVNFDKITAETLNLTISKVGTEATPASIELGATVSPTTKTLNATLTDSYLSLDDGGVTAVIETATIAVSGENVVDFNDLKGTIKKMTVSGDGSLDGTGAPTALTVLTDLTSTAEGGIIISAEGGALATVPATAGNNSISADGSKLTTATFGSGDDTLTLTTDGLGASAKIDMGAGKDKVVLAADTATGAVVDGGEGDDTLNIVNGTHLVTGADKIYTNFEYLDLGGGKGTYDLAFLPSIKHVVVDGAALAAAVTISNAEAGTDFTFISQDGTDTATGFAVTATLTANAKMTEDTTVTLKAVDTDGDGTEGESKVTVTSLDMTGFEKTLNIVSSLEGGEEDSTASDYVNTIATLTTASSTIAINADTASLTVTTLADTAVTKIDASASAGDVQSQTCFKTQAL